MNSVLNWSDKKSMSGIICEIHITSSTKRKLYGILYNHKNNIYIITLYKRCKFIIKNGVEFIIKYFNKNREQQEYVCHISNFKIHEDFCIFDTNIHYEDVYYVINKNFIDYNSKYLLDNKYNYPKLTILSYNDNINSKNPLLITGNSIICYEDISILEKIQTDIDNNTLINSCNPVFSSISDWGVVSDDIYISGLTDSNFQEIIYVDRNIISNLLHH